MNLPETRFVAVGEDRVAWQALGSGPRDLVIVSGLWSHLDLLWEETDSAAAFRRLATFSRLIRYDRRGSGLSDPRPEDGAPLDYWIEDLDAVLDAAESRRCVLLAIGDTGPLALRYYATRRARIDGLILVNTSARLTAAPDYPEGHPEALTAEVGDRIRTLWGREQADGIVMPGDPTPQQLRQVARLQRAMASPRAMQANLAMTATLDSRDVLATVSVPTLVVTHTDNSVFSAAQGRYLARHIPGAQLIEWPGNPRLAWEGGPRLLSAIETFITGQSQAVPPQRALLTLLMTDIVDSTRELARRGDAAWRALLDRCDEAMRNCIARHGGLLVDATGDGTLMRFATPGAAIDCAGSIHAAMAELDLAIRAGIHIGEVELRDEGRIGGMAVHIAARVLARADGGETWVSRTVRDVMIGSHYRFRERGIHSLKGVPSKWPLYAVETD